MRFLLLLLMFSPTNSSANYQSYFLETYEESRDAFLKQVNDWSSQGRKLQKGQWNIPSQKDNQLTTNWVYLPPKKEKGNLIIIVSGVHGVEAFASTAVQRMFMREVFPQTQDGQTGFLFIHVINPYGHKYSRRVTENNVDLNRNFINNRPFDFLDPNGEYPKLDRFLNPENPVNISPFSRFQSLLQSLYYIVRHSKRKVRQAILQGQYSFPKGIFYGGPKTEPHVEPLKTLLQEKTAGYKKNLLIDLHTGYGERGKLHLFGLPHYNDQTKKAMQEVFKGYSIDSGKDKDFYTITGDLTAYAFDILQGELTLAITFEYGTLDSQTTKGSLDSLQRTKWENQGFWWGYRDQKTETKVKQWYREMFYPSDPQWRQAIMKESARTFPILIRRLQKLNPAKL